MGRTKRRKTSKRKSRKQGALHGIAKAVDSGRIMDALTVGGSFLLASVAGAFVGAAIGRNSLAIGIPVTLAGAYAKSTVLMAAGAGLVLSNGFQSATKPTDGVEGFDVKQIAQNAKDRVGTFFDNFKEKLYIPPTSLDTGTSGLGAKDDTKYFINPYSTKELDLSELERVEEQVAAMTQGTSGFASSGFEIDIEDREF